MLCEDCRNVWNDDRWVVRKKYNIFINDFHKTATWLITMLEDPDIHVASITFQPKPHGTSTMSPELIDLIVNMLTFVTKPIRIVFQNLIFIKTFGKITEGLLSCNHVIGLEILNCFLMLTSITGLRNYLSATQTLQKLTLHNVELECTKCCSTNYLDELLTCCKSLKKLYVAQMKMSNMCLLRLCESLSTNTTLKDLTLLFPARQEDITNPNLGMVLWSNTTLTRLHTNLVQDKRLLTSLKHNTTLTHLSLGSIVPKFNFGGVDTRIGEMLMVNTTLVQLSFATTFDRCMPDALMCNTTLKDLSLRPNFRGDCPMYDVIKALCVNTTLTSFKSYQKFTVQRAYDILIRMLQQNTTLQRFSINPIDREDIDDVDIYSILRDHPSLLSGEIVTRFLLDYRTYRYNGTTQRSYFDTLMREYYYKYISPVAVREILTITPYAQIPSDEEIKKAISEKLARYAKNILF